MFVFSFSRNLIRLIYSCFLTLASKFTKQLFKSLFLQADDALVIPQILGVIPGKLQSLRVRLVVMKCVFSPQFYNDSLINQWYTITNFCQKSLKINQIFETSRNYVIENPLAGTCSGSLSKAARCRPVRIRILLLE